MKRPLAVISIFFIAGIFTAKECGTYLLSLAPVLPILIILLLIKKKYRIGKLFIFSACLVYLAGAVLFLFSDNAVKKRFEESAGKPLQFCGYISSDPDIKKYTTGYEYSITSYTENESINEAPVKAMLWIKNDDSSSGYKYGDCIEVFGAAEIPDGIRNPGGFDYRSYLAGKGISVLLYADSCKATGEKKGNPVIEFGRFARDRIIKVIGELLPQQQAALLNGMLIGYRESLPEEVGDAFRNAGLSHIMAVSGANLVFLIMPLLFLMRNLGAGRIFSNAAVIICIAVFVLITGFEPSVVRAAVMAAIVLLGDILKREPDILTSIAAAAICLLSFNPHSLFEVGFQLSFIATLSLVLITPGLQNIFKKIKFTGGISTLLAATLAAQIGVAPVAAYHFNTVSLISLITNLLVVPLTGIITILGMAMALLGQFFIAGARILAYINCSLLSLVLYTTGLSSKIRFASILIATPQLPFMAAWYLSVLLFSGRISVNHKYTAICAILAAAAVFGTASDIAATPGMEVVFFDVGYGDSVLIHTGNGKNILIDTGPGYSSGSGAGEKVIVPYLLDEGILHIDMIILTHSHSDHTAGFADIAEMLDTDVLAVYEGFDRSGRIQQVCTERNIELVNLSAGDVLKLDKEIFLKVLHPNAGADNYAPNPDSIVLKMEYGETEILLTGDIEKRSEEMILAQGFDIGADVVKIAHHGSVTSSTEGFLSAVNAKAAVISVGRNKFGHPDGEVMDRLANSDIITFRTDLGGALRLVSDGKTIKIYKTVYANDSD